MRNVLSKNEAGVLKIALWMVLGIKTLCCVELAGLKCSPFELRYADSLAILSLSGTNPKCSQMGYFGVWLWNQVLDVILTHLTVICQLSGAVICSVSGHL